MPFYHSQVFSVRIPTCHEEMYLTMFANRGEYIGTLSQRNKKRRSPRKKKSNPTSVSSNLISSVSTWALSPGYGSKAEILKFLLEPNLP